MPVNSSRSARIRPSRSSGEHIPISGGDGGGVGNMTVKFDTQVNALEESNQTRCPVGNVLERCFMPLRLLNRPWRDPEQASKRPESGRPVDF